MVDNKMKHNLIIVSVALFTFLMFCTGVVCAGEVTVVEKYAYQANENDSKMSSRVIAFDYVKKLLVEDLYVHVENIKELKNLNLPKDRMIILISGIIEPEIIEEKWDGKTYYIKARISLDIAELIHKVDTAYHDREISKDLEYTRMESEISRKELEMIRASRKKQENYLRAIRQLGTANWVERGYALRNSGNYLESVEAFNNAIEINPSYARAYVGRSGSYRRLGQYEQAMKDANTAISLDQNFAGGYRNRGYVYAGYGDYRHAIQDYEMAIKLDSADDKTFYYRGLAYNELGHYHLALGDFNMAIEIDPNYAMAYFARGITYYNSGNYQQAIDSFKSAAKLGYKPAQDRLISYKIKW